MGLKSSRPEKNWSNDNKYTIRCQLCANRVNKEQIRALDKGTRLESKQILFYKPPVIESQPMHSR